MTISKVNKAQRLDSDLYTAALCCLQPLTIRPAETPDSSNMRSSSWRLSLLDLKRKQSGVLQGQLQSYHFTFQRRKV